MNDLDVKGTWRTVRGQKIFIRDGENTKQVLVDRFSGYKNAVEFNGEKIPFSGNVSVSIDGGIKPNKVKQLKGIAEVWNKTHADYRSKIKRINITIEHKTHHTAVGSYEDGVVSLYLWNDDIDYRPIMKHECQHSVWANLTRAEKDEIVKQVLDKNIVGMTDYVMNIKTKAEVSKSPQAIKYYNELFAEELNSEWFALRDYKQEHEANTAEWVMMGEFDKFGAILESVLGKDYLKKSIIENMEMLKAVLNLPDSELQTWDGKRGIWRTIRGHKIFFPNGEDTELIMKKELDKITKVDDVKKDVSKKEVKPKSKKVTKSKKYKNVMLKFKWGDVTFKGSKTTIKLSPQSKKYINKNVENVSYGFNPPVLPSKKMKEIAEVYNNLPQEYLDGVDVFYIDIRGGAGGSFQAYDRKLKPEVRVMVKLNNPHYKSAMRHEFAHSVWHKLPKETQDRIVDRVFKEGIVGSKYSERYFKGYNRIKMAKPHRRGSGDVYMIGYSNKPIPKKSDAYLYYKKNLFVNEVHSEWFATKSYPNENEDFNKKDFERFGKILEEELGKEYMEKSIRNMEKTLQRVSRYGVIEA